MSLENWVKNSWLERRESDAAEIARLLGLADGRLEDYQRAVAGKLSSDVQLGLAYDAIRISATAALRAAGYRVVRGGSEHYRTIEALEFSIDPQKKIIPTLDKLRKKRNVGSYDDYGLEDGGPCSERSGTLDSQKPRRQDRLKLGSNKSVRSVHVKSGQSALRSALTRFRCPISENPLSIRIRISRQGFERVPPSDSGLDLTRGVASDR
jgi:hypothetical protein